jgi:hypothetical protein
MEKRPGERSALSFAEHYRTHKGQIDGYVRELRDVALVRLASSLESPPSREVKREASEGRDSVLWLDEEPRAKVDELHEVIEIDSD